MSTLKHITSNLPVTWCNPETSWLTAGWGRCNWCYRATVDLFFVALSDKTRSYETRIQILPLNHVRLFFIATLPSLVSVRNGGTQNTTCGDDQEDAGLSGNCSSLTLHVHNWMSRDSMQSHVHKHLTNYFLHFYRPKTYTDIGTIRFLLSKQWNKSMHTHSSLPPTRTHTFHLQHTHKHAHPQHTYPKRGFYDRVTWSRLDE